MSQKTYFICITAILAINLWMPMVKIQLGKGVRIFHPDLVNLYDYVIGD